MRTFQHALSIVLNSKGEISLERDDEGNLSADDASDILALMEKFAKEQKTTVSEWSYFCPVVDAEGQPVFETLPSGKLKLSGAGKPITKTAPFTDKKAREGKEIAVLANRFGKPYVAVLAPKAAKAKADKPGKKKLA